MPFRPDDHGNHQFHGDVPSHVVDAHFLEAAQVALPGINRMKKEERGKKGLELAQIGRKPPGRGRFRGCIPAWPALRQILPAGK